MKTVRNPHPKGFALVVSLTMLVLLTIIAVGLLGLSAITLRTTTQSMAQQEAQANARMALMIAIGELQREMGPDMRVSTQSAIFDGTPDSPGISGIDQSRWLASYDSWGDWLNAPYARLDDSGNRMSQLSIQDTYTDRRATMFRRWLLSLPDNMTGNINAPDSISGWNDSNSVVLVGEGTLGSTAPTDEITRAWLKDLDGNGRHAWWIGPENQKARTDLASNPRNISSAQEWEVAHGDTAEVGAGALPGFSVLDNDEELSRKMITSDTLPLAGITDTVAKSHFFDLTSHSRGLQASVRTGGLKKDLSLLFEQPNSQLPDRYRFNSGDDREPSIRPLSPDLRGLHRNQVEARHFQSWTNMRHFHRMYRNSNDASSAPMASGGGSVINWQRGAPITDPAFPLFSSNPSNNTWDGSNHYWRMPLLAKITFIYSLMAEPAGDGDADEREYQLYLVYTPVLTYWNPYNTQMRLPSEALRARATAWLARPIRWQMWLGLDTEGNPTGHDGATYRRNTHSVISSGGGSDLVFQPGEMKVFSYPDYVTDIMENMVPGFNPVAIDGGNRIPVGNGTYRADQQPGLSITFGPPNAFFNINHGNTPGSLVLTQHWDDGGSLPTRYNIDWFDKNQVFTPLNEPGPGGVFRFQFGDTEPVPVAFAQLVIKGLSEFDHPTINWAEDWRSRNWLHAPPSYFGSALYMSDNSAIAHTQRLESPYIMNFGPLSMFEMPQIVFQDGEQAFLGSGSNPVERVSRVPLLELPTAPVGSLAGYAGMRINPGWTEPQSLNPNLRLGGFGGITRQTNEASLYRAEMKEAAYQSGVIGVGIGNSFVHPMIGRTNVYQYLNNSVSHDNINRSDPTRTQANDNMVFSDFWDHAFLLNDALWDDYFVSSLAEHTRGSDRGANSLRQNIDRFINDGEIANSRFTYHSSGLDASDVRGTLEAADGYLHAARHLMVEGMFNVNSTSVDAWYALFAGIRERTLVYRNAGGRLLPVQVPADRRIAISRFNTAVSDQEMTDPTVGVSMPDGGPGWSDVRFLSDDQLRLLAEQCVRQVKLRGPFLNFSEFINRRLSNDELGLMGALQSAIDFDDASPDPSSINYAFKRNSAWMDAADGFGSPRRSLFQTREAANGSRLAGIPGYVVQSDLLKPIANTLSVRDDTFRIRAYGESRDAAGNVLARAWCEAIVQRVPEYYDSSANGAHEPARVMIEGGRGEGAFEDNPELSEMNRRFGRQFQIESFRWLSRNEI